jgi:hypothetical protein
LIATHSTGDTRAVYYVGVLLVNFVWLVGLVELRDVHRFRQCAICQTLHQVYAGRNALNLDSAFYVFVVIARQLDIQSNLHSCKRVANAIQSVVKILSRHQRQGILQNPGHVLEFGFLLRPTWVARRLVLFCCQI